MTDDSDKSDDSDGEGDMGDRLTAEQKLSLDDATKKVGGAKNGFEIVPVSGWTISPLCTNWMF